ncbi:hypothetical protein GCM10009560_78360 [Nonomuraea longicatena]|uniref:Transposase n=1 Tax=Nonomuraea longicatena TaxID=83682 RepID=A0ABN1RBD9_9ACTN
MIGSLTSNIIRSLLVLLGEAVDLVTALAGDVRAAVQRAARLAYAILDGTLIPIDRLADPVGRLVWASPALPGAIHDISQARTVGLIDTLTSAGVKIFADKCCQGAGGTIRTPFKRHRYRPWLSRG